MVEKECGVKIVPFCTKRIRVYNCQGLSIISRFVLSLYLSSDKGNHWNHRENG